MALPKKLQEEFNDFTVWWNYHSDKVSSYPPDRRQEFVLHAINQQNYLLVELAREVNGQRDGNDKVIALPRNFQFGGKRQ